MFSPDHGVVWKYIPPLLIAKFYCFTQTLYYCSDKLSIIHTGQQLLDCLLYVIVNVFFAVFSLNTNVMKKQADTWLQQNDKTAKCEHFWKDGEK